LVNDSITFSLSTSLLVDDETEAVTTI